MQTLSALLALRGAALGMAGCNTIAGIGKGVQRVGQAVRDASGK